MPTVLLVFFGPLPERRQYAAVKPEEYAEEPDGSHLLRDWRSGPIAGDTPAQ